MNIAKTQGLVGRGFFSFLLFLVLVTVLLPASDGQRVTLGIEGGKSWGASLSGPLLSAKLLLPVWGGLSLGGSYTHHFNPERNGRSIKSRSLLFALEYKSREAGRRLRWFVHGDAGLMSSRYFPDQDDYNEFGIGLGAGLEKPLSPHLAIRLDARVLANFNKDSIFGDAWGETTLGLMVKL